jgi:hypothetical protein
VFLNRVAAPRSISPCGLGGWCALGAVCANGETGSSSRSVCCCRAAGGASSRTVSLGKFGTSGRARGESAGSLLGASSSSSSAILTSVGAVVFASTISRGVPSLTN